MTHETPKRPDDIVLLMAAAMLFCVVAVFTHGTAEMVAGVLWLAAGSWSVWNVGRWLWASARHHRG